MYVQIHNENYGYAVATFGDYVVVANPSITRYDPLTQSIFHTGSVDYFRYNKTSDQHDYVGTFHKSKVDIDVLLARESDRKGLQTEPDGVVPTTSDLGLCIDKDRYTASADDGYGLSLDMYKKMLIVGSPYYTQFITTDANKIAVNGSSVDIYDLGLSEFSTLGTTTNIYTIDDPDILLPTWQPESFGRAVSINDAWLAIGSPFINNSGGMVYMYKNISTGSNNYSWSLYQRLTPTNVINASEFGYSLKLNKCTSSYSNSLVVGSGNPATNAAFYFEFINNEWSQTFIFLQDYKVLPMTFSEYLPYQPVMNIENGFGNAVSLYENTVIIGEYLDRSFYEFSGSVLYQQGSAYIFEKCTNVPYTLFEIALKTYGTKNTLKNNKLGFSVDIFGNNAVIGIPKTNTLDITSCYIAGTIEQLHYCNPSSEELLQGQEMLLQRNTSSNAWEITNVYQKKKRFLGPYRSYGFDVAVADKSMVIGAPMYMSDNNRQINITMTSSNDISMESINGKSYIYNWNNLRDKFHIGNVFYRNGKIIVMTSGSIFDGLFFNPFITDTYEYDLHFKSQYTIFENQIVCNITPGEFNVSTNPTAIIRQPSLLDVNGNGLFDFQDVDVILRYMQYKNTSFLGVPISTDWSSSIVVSDDEISLLNWYQTNTIAPDTSTRTSASIIKWETENTWMQNALDLNQDNRIDIRDMNIIWKYFTRRLTQQNYAIYITPSCHRKLFSDVIDCLDSVSQRNAKPLINPLFLDYDRLASIDKTGSFLAPMVTTIGLYSGLDLVSVAKLGSPIKITPELPYNFIVKMDY